MPDPTSNDISLHLLKIEDLFVDPDTNPFENPNLGISGIQTILNELYKQKLAETLRLTIYLPAEEISPGLVERTKEALQRYCTFQAANSDVEVRNTRLDGRRALGVGIIGSLGFVFLAALGYFLSSSQGAGPLGILGMLIGGFFALAAWVIIWTPVDTLLYYWRPAWREARKYRLIAKADIRILPEN